MRFDIKKIIGVIIDLGIIYLFFVFDIPYRATPDDFKTCVALGNPVTDSYPRQCSTKNGILFREDSIQASSTPFINNVL